MITLSHKLRRALTTFKVCLNMLFSNVNITVIIIMTLVSMFVTVPQNCILSILTDGVREQSAQEDIWTKEG
jgi:hypothetical protein